MAKARVIVTLKPGVLDPQGKAVAGGLQALGYEGVSEVRVGKYIEVELGDAQGENLDEKVAEMCRRLLANPVIEEFRYEIDREEGA